MSWRALLPELKGLPLLPCGAGTDHKAPLDPATGRGLAQWQTAAFTPDQLAELNGSLVCVGTRCGPDAGGLLAFDLDGTSAIAAAKAAGCDPADALTWQVRRSTANDRLKVLWRVPTDLWPHLERGKGVRVTAAPDRVAGRKGEQIECFWSSGQVLVLGDHRSSGGQYVWSGSPDLTAEIPPEWWALALKLLGPHRQPAASQPTAPTSLPPIAGDDLQRAEDALRFLDPDLAHDDWVRVGMALHSCDPGVGFDLWNHWSAKGSKYPGARALEAKWASFHGSGGVSIATLFRQAEQAGWSNPARGRGKPPAHQRDRRSQPPVAPSSGHRPAPAGDSPRQAEQQPPSPSHRILSLQEVTDRLREAIAEGEAASALTQLVAELAAASDQSPLALQRIADALKAEQRQAAEVYAEAATLAAEADRQEIGQILTPSYLLPASLAAAIETRTRYLPCQGPSAVMPFLAAVAGLVKLGTEVEAAAVAGYRVPVNLFACLVGRSGAKKSPIGRLLVEEPTRELRAELARANQREHAAWIEACRELKKGEARPPDPHPKRLVVSEFTGEALAAQLQVQEAAGLGLLVNRDELSGLFGGLNAYRGGRGADEQQLLELFDGGGLSSLRVVGDRHYSRSQMSVWGATQPDVLRQLVAGGDASGLWARFLFVPLPERVVPLPLSTTPAEVAEVEAAAQTLADACAAIYRRPPQTYRLAPAAAEHFARFELNRQRAALATSIGAQSALYGKSAGKVLRLAGVLHLLQLVVGEIDPHDLIQPETIDRAAALVDHLDGWALSFHAEVASGTVGGLMRTVHRAAEAAGAPIRWKEIQNRLTRAQRKETDPSAVQEAMRALAAAGYGEVEAGKRGALSYRALRPLP